MALETYMASENELQIIKEENCIKFGEIVLSDDGIFTFICNFCQEIFSKSILLIHHINETHVSVEKKAIKEAFLTRPTDLEKLEDNLFSNLNVKFDVTSIEPKNLNIPELNGEDHSSINSQDTNISINYEKYETILQNPTSQSVLEENMKIEPVQENLKNKIPHNPCKSVERVNIKDWQCPICNLIIRCTSKYEHLKRHTGKTTFKCEYCNEEFTTELRRQRHEKIHTGHPAIQCPNCPKNFKTKVNLKNHIKREHLGIREHKCDYCEKRFYVKLEKISHERSQHTNEKPFICEICGRGFRVQPKLNTHMQTHYEPKYECDKCNKKFYLKANLKGHEICHSNLKPYSCEICSANFPRLKAYKTHLKLHSDIKDYICKLCGKDFYDIPRISGHMKSAHKTQYNKTNILRRSQMKEDDLENDWI